MVVVCSTFLRDCYERFTFESLAREFYLIHNGFVGNFVKRKTLKNTLFFFFLYRDCAIPLFSLSLSPSLPSSFLFFETSHSIERTSHGWKQDMEIHLELPSPLYECRRGYLRAIFRHSRTQLCKQVFASGVKESIVATLQRYRSSFSSISAERKFPILSHLSRTFEFSLLILYIVTTRRMDRLYYLTKISYVTRTCAKVFESMKILIDRIITR